VGVPSADEVDVNESSSSLESLLAVGATTSPHTGPQTGAIGKTTDFAEVQGERMTEGDRERRVALTDELTHLANRPSLLLEAGRALDRSSRHRRHAGLLVVGLDRFSLVDDSLGRQLSNDVLREVASRLQKAARTHDLVARLEGDRFGVLLDMLHDPQEVIAVTGRIEAALREPMQVAEHNISLTATVGIAVSDGDASAGDLLDQALAAMYRAKRLGGARWEIYDATLRAETLGRLRMESELRSAISTGGFRPWYQPIINVATGDVVAIEAFVRWIHPDLGVLPPGAFLSVAEDCGLLPSLWRVMLDDASSFIARVRSSAPHLANLGLVLNLSPRQIGQPGLVESLRTKFEQHGLSPSVCTLDLQLATIANLSRHRDVLMELRAIGVGIALDDVGSAGLPIAELREFPVDVLKLDPSLTASMTSGSTDSGMVLGLVHVARALNAIVIAEGVERLNVLRQVETVGISHAQGHLICPALPEEDLIPLLARPRPFIDQLSGSTED
jgi:diguanylate cyclase (GGDEF)-like protein